MKRQRSSSTSNKSSKKPRYARQDATVTAVVRKELRKKTDWLYCDYAVTNNAIYNNSQPASLLANLSRGDAGINQFNGNIIRPQAITVKYFAQTAQAAYQALRVIIFQWFDSATPALSGVLQNDATTLALVSPTLITNKGFLKILYDQLHTCALTAADGTTLGNGLVHPVTVYIPGKRLRPIRFPSSGATPTPQDGGLFVLALSDDQALGTINLTLYSRITFADSAV